MFIQSSYHEDWLSHTCPLSHWQRMGDLWHWVCHCEDTVVPYFFLLFVQFQNHFKLQPYPCLTFFILLYFLSSPDSNLLLNFFVWFLPLECKPARSEGFVLLLLCVTHWSVPLVGQVVCLTSIWCVMSGKSPLSIFLLLYKRHFVSILSPCGSHLTPWWPPATPPPHGAISVYTSASSLSRYLYLNIMYLLFHVGHEVQQVRARASTVRDIQQVSFKSLQDMENGGCVERGNGAAG